MINIPSENLSKLSKERMQYFRHALKLKLRTLSKCKQLFDEQVARTKHDYKFSTMKSRRIIAGKNTDVIVHVSIVA